MINIFFKRKPIRIYKRYLKRDNSHYLEHKDKARKYVIKEIEEINKLYNFEFKRIFIRNQRSRWGSCSSKGNLNFNYRIVLLPQELSKYIIVHEICHLKEFNHSKRFWNLVSLCIPNYKEVRKKLRELKLNNIQ